MTLDVVTALKEGLAMIADSIARRKGTFVLAKTEPTDGIPNPFVLAVGSIRVVSIGKGFLITLGLARSQVEALRAMCDEALAEKSS